MVYDLYMYWAAFFFLIAFDTHRYFVEDSELRIYPADVTLTNRQKHAVLYQLAGAMKQGTAQDIADFIRISLTEMAALYEEAAMQTGNKSTSITEGVQLSRWRNDTLELANKLYYVADTLNPGMSLDIIIDDTGELQLIIEDKIYILSNPVINKPYLLDERIINSVCSIRVCNDELIASHDHLNKREIIIEATWKIIQDEKPEYITSDGLHFVFNNIGDRSRKQIACLKIIKEIKFVAASLKEANQKGIPLEWDSITIKPLYGSFDYRISLNTFGDSIYIKLPELHHVSGWENLLLSWIRAQVDGESYDQYLEADHLLVYTLN